MTMRTLHCQAGNHAWERPAQRGRPPLNCPEHQPVKPEVTKPVTVAKPKPVEKPLPAPEKPSEQPEHLRVALEAKRAQKAQEEARYNAEAVGKADESGLPVRVVAAFLKHGLPIPTRETVDSIGYTSKQINAIGVS